MADKPPLTEEMIEELSDDDPHSALELIIEYNIDAAGVVSTADAQKRLRDYLIQNRETDGQFKCQECDLTEDDINIDLDLEKACQLLEKHHITQVQVNTLEDACNLLLKHLTMKNDLEEDNLLGIYSTDKVAKVVQELVEQNRIRRCELLNHCDNVQKYVKTIPKARQADISHQLPTMEVDLSGAQAELQRDDCTIMIAGETGSGKSCLLNLLLGELFAELMSVNNLPSTSALTEIKHDESPYLKAHLAEGSHPPEIIPLDKDTAPATIQKYTHQKGDRTHFKYNKVEVFWPCDWIKNGITITDTPGVGENEELTNLVKDYIPQAYGFIYVINTPNAGGINPEELEDLLFYHITQMGLTGNDNMTTGEHASRVKFDPRSAIFVCNKWDQVAANERDEIKAHVRKKLKKVWRDFNFEHQVFFLSAKKTIEEVKSGYVSKEYRRLLLGIQKLLPVGFKSKLEKQFWKLFHVMDRCTWVLKNYILCEHSEQAKKKKRKQYKQAKEKLREIEKRPEIARKDMETFLQKQVKTALSQIHDHMQSKEAKERLLTWNDSDCPDNDNMDRLLELQYAYAQKRIKQEINRFEQDKGIFEGIQKQMIQRFREIFLSVESELACIEEDLKEDPKYNLQHFPPGQDAEYLEESTQLSTAATAVVWATSPIWIPLGIVAGVFALPFIGIQGLMKQRTNREQLKQYRSNKPEIMHNVTEELLREFLQSDKLNQALHQKLQQLHHTFKQMLDKIPNLIEADLSLVTKLEKELDNQQDFKTYLPIYEAGLKLQDELNLSYLLHVRTFDIDMSDVKNLKKIGEGAFAIVYKGKLSLPDGNSIDVAVKRQKNPISVDTATDFMTEELNLLRIQSSNVVKYLGASFKRNKEVMYPVMVQEYCATNLTSVIYDTKLYKGPGRVSESDPSRKALLERAARYSDEISRGLMTMHKMGMVHRDLKPENILVDKDGRIKVGDLGISKLETDIVMTMAGTPLYMAPEVLKERRYNRSVDIFSLGLILWEIWYGQPIEKVYYIDNYAEFKMTAFKPNKPPEDWLHLMSKCWSTKPQERPSAYECSQLFSKYYN